MNFKIKSIFMIMALIGFILAVIGVISLFFLQTTIMQVNFNGDSSTGYLSAMILRRTFDFEEMDHENPVTLVNFDSFQVDQSGVYTLTSVEPQVGEIAIQESPIQSLLGIDDLAFILVGFVVMGIGVVLFAIFQRRARFNSIEEYKYE